MLLSRLLPQLAPDAEPSVPHPLTLDHDDPLDGLNLEVQGN